MSTSSRRTRGAPVRYLREVLRRYERQVLPVFKRHGGAFERIWTTPADVAEPTTDPEAPDEIHLLRFDREDGLEAARRDPEMQALAELRDTIVRRAVLVRVADCRWGATSKTRPEPAWPDVPGCQPRRPSALGVADPVSHAMDHGDRRAVGGDRDVVEPGPPAVPPLTGLGDEPGPRGRGDQEADRHREGHPGAAPGVAGGAERHVGEREDHAAVGRALMIEHRRAQRERDPAAARAQVQVLHAQLLRPRLALERGGPIRRLAVASPGSGHGGYGRMVALTVSAVSCEACSVR